MATAEHVDVAIIGGQAGLATSHAGAPSETGMRGSE